MTKDQLDAMVSGIFETAEFKQLVYALGRVLSEHKPVVGLVALQTVMAGIVEKHDAACAGQLANVYRFVIADCAPSNTTQPIIEKGIA